MSTSNQQSDEIQQKDVPVHLVAYETDADLDVSEAGEIENHDELVNTGQTYDEIRMLTRKSVEENGLESEIVEPGDALWCDAVAELGRGEAIRVDELRSE